MSDFEPTIIAFVCNWCTYTAADLAGTSRLAYPQNVRLIRVMCTGMVDPQYIIKALLEGADGVSGERVPSRGLPLHQRQLQSPAPDQTAEGDSAPVRLRTRTAAG